MKLSQVLKDALKNLMEVESYLVSCQLSNKLNSLLKKPDKLKKGD